jgi:hypothetical protein
VIVLNAIAFTKSWVSKGGGICIKTEFPSPTDFYEQLKKLNDNFALFEVYASNEAHERTINELKDIIRIKEEQILNLKLKYDTSSDYQ